MKLVDTYATAIMQYVQAGGTRYAYRRMGRESGVPLIFMQTFRQGTDNIDPLLLDGFGQDRPGHHLRQRWCRANLTYMKPANKPYPCRFRTSRAKSARLV
jgi:hypothetical protein